MKNNKRLVGALLLVSLISTVFADDTPSWSYQDATGAKYWADLSPDYNFCRKGQNQSPINIDPQKTVVIQNKGIKFNYGLIKPEAIVNTGKGIHLNVGQGTTINVDGVTFDLKQLQFHMPSENTVSNKHFPLEIQFIHESKDKELAYVSMMFIPGKADRTLTKIIAQLPKQAGESKPLKENTLRSIEMKKKLGNYYQYSGSMTTPPCTEGVHWYIMQTPLTLSTEQQTALKQAIGQDNNRPLQALNARLVAE